MLSCVQWPAKRPQNRQKREGDLNTNNRKTSVIHSEHVIYLLDRCADIIFNSYSNNFFRILKKVCTPGGKTQHFRHGTSKIFAKIFKTLDTI